MLYPSRMQLLRGLLDYAGLFPPAALPLHEALRNHLTYANGEHAWFLGRFVCPATRLEELAQKLTPAATANLSVLVNSPDDLQRIDDFHRLAPRTVRADCIEVKYTGPDAAREWTRRWNYLCFFEVGAEHFEQAVLHCGPAPRVGLKLRTGSVNATQIPPARTLLHFLQLTREHRLPFKFTAGLHHARPGVYPLTYEPDSPSAPMYGFLSLFGLACLFWWERLSANELERGLQDAQIQADESGLHWGEAHCNPQEIEQFRREGGQSFGSCSFEEPVADLKEMQWI